MSTPEEDELLAPGRSRALFKEALGLYAVAFFLVLGLALLSGSVGLISANLYALVAAVFVGLPYWWIGRKKLDGERYGLRAEHMLRDIGIGLVAGIITLVPFAVGQYVWETQALGHEAHFSMENWQRWSAHIDGEPAQWGHKPGVWLWSQRGTFRLGMREASGEKIKVLLKASTPFLPEHVGSGMLVRARNEQGSYTKSRSPHTEWELQPTLGFRRVMIEIPTVSEAASAPRALDVRVSYLTPTTETPEVYVGPFEQRDEDGELELERTMMWLLLWGLTQIFFIALPEEYFYRGYLQVRLNEAFAARKGSGKAARWAGISAGNLLTSVLFGLGHLLVPVGGVLLLSRFTVFFPSLIFGWLRERTGGIVAPLVYHACCNMMVLIMAAHYR